MANDRSNPQFWIKVTREGGQAKKLGVDVDARITDFTFEDAEKTHKLTFTVDNFDLKHFDATPLIADGDLLEFSFGYPGNMSPPRSGVVTKVTGGIKLKVEALGKEFLLNKELKTRTHANMKRSDVAKLIAQEHGFGPSEQHIDDTQVVFPVISQTRLSDFQLLRQLAPKEGFEVYCDAAGFHFERRKLSKPPSATFTYYTDGTGTLLAFPNVEMDITTKPGAVNAKGVDLLKGKKVEARGDNASTKGRESLAPVLEVVDKQSGQTSLQSRKANETTVLTTARDPKDAQRQVDGAYQKAQMAAVKFKVPAVGDPQVGAKTIAEFRNIGVRLSGLYFLSTVTHKIGSSGYTMDIEARRDGTSSGSGSGTPAGSKGAQNNQAPAKPGEMKAVETVDKKSGQTTTVYKKS